MENLWKDFVNIWAYVCTGFPEVITMNLETSFTSQNFGANVADL